MKDKFKTIGLMFVAAIVALMLEPIAHAAITVPYTFTAFTTISSTQMNANFTALTTKALDKTGDTMTGDLKFTDASYDIGKSGLTRPRDLFISRNGNIGGTLTVTGNVISDLKFTDATYDIGKSGATRPRDGFFSRNVVVGGTFTINSLAYTFPASQSANYFLQTNGSGTLSWAAVTSACYGTVTGKTASYAAALCDVVEITANSSITITLPAASTCTAASNHIGLKNDVAATVTVARTGSDMIDGVAGNFTSYGVQYESYDFVCNAAGNGWMVR